MSQPFVGEIRMFGGNFAPAGWSFCDGQLLAISENDTLFNLIGTTYGGDGQTTFALPDLRGRLPLHLGTGGGSTYVLADEGGAESVTLTSGQIPAHSHTFVATTNIANQNSAAGNLLAQPAVIQEYFPSSGTSSLSNSSMGLTGGSQPHSNIQPFLAINFIISLFGIFPSQT